MDHMKWIVYSGDESMTISTLMSLDDSVDDVFPELQSWTQEHWVQWTIEWESDFHYKLLLIKTKPHIIYYMGNLDLLNQPILWIVWPRMHSSYATEVLTKLFALAPGYAFATISGLAPGVDQLCHRLSLQKWIPTIAVLGWWLQWYLWNWNRKLIQQIVDNGWLVLSEFKLNLQPQLYTFPQRNRIIAGLADVVFLPEAGANSGSLITANFALEMKKPVYGVPNTIFSSASTGVNQLISSWVVKPVVDIQQFLDTCFTKTSFAQSIVMLPDLTQEEQTLISFLWEKQTCSLTDFLSLGSFSSSEIISLLTLLEMKECICQESPGVYKLNI